MYCFECQRKQNLGENRLTLYKVLSVHKLQIATNYRPEGIIWIGQFHIGLKILIRLMW